MSALSGQKPVFRFAPSPNGLLHLGHALSAILNFEMAKAANGRFLLRMEDIDIARCKPEYEEAIEEDLAWLGLDWEKSVRRQSEHISEYAAALEKLKAKGLIYPAFMSRTEIRRWVENYEAEGAEWPRDPDGAPHYPPDDKALSEHESAARIASGEKHVWRLDMEKAVKQLFQALTFTETGPAHTGLLPADPARWGDVMLWRWDAPSSYHLSVVVDDALQGVSHVVRGLDLFYATSVHRLLQTLLGLPEPIYHHHRLILGEDGRKLSKSNASTALSALREQGLSAGDLRILIDQPTL
ncbi:tRNA glutamyl-Q(34) synthetase GluQRS [Rhizobium sp. L1K21]|uniref:tRNA glutamyl-Q(34) synthetase GluQRS n=1 Tax=Rhizobium sp. L1K21 TaxID=2954933 RepID=UPI002093F6CB|nr:tRNA glutamyl-Q(34) synthetase GluQRS [Rhizobium sp. L1K21]MCO6188186.1 tRNA glutamyl-Q(34) synthetase GluQRS [Rhizobium sp. L1K21]